MSSNRREAVQAATWPIAYLTSGESPKRQRDG
jgi:hypothetical protein